MLPTATHEGLGRCFRDSGVLLGRLPLGGPQQVHTRSREEVGDQSWSVHSGSWQMINSAWDSISLPIFKFSSLTAVRTQQTKNCSRGRLENSTHTWGGSRASAALLVSRLTGTHSNDSSATDPDRGQQQGPGGYGRRATLNTGWPARPTWPAWPLCPQERTGNLFCTLTGTMENCTLNVKQPTLLVPPSRLMADTLWRSVAPVRHLRVGEPLASVGFWKGKQTKGVCASAVRPWCGTRSETQNH